MTLPRTPSFQLDGRRCLVAGGSRGIGFAAAVALCEAGAQVTLMARGSPALTQAQEALHRAGYSVDAIAFDLNSGASVEDVLKEHGTFDVLVNSAGMARHAPLVEITDELIDPVIDLNVKAAFRIAQAVAKRLIVDKKPGSIIQISSQMGHVGGPKRSIYCASKFAVEGMTKAMAIELGKHQIRVNTLCPTFIETELTRASFEQSHFRTWVLERIKLGRIGQVEDIMGPIVFLASDASQMMTGASLVIDGGWTAD